jgi:hypothetical protein
MQAREQIMERLTFPGKAESEAKTPQLRQGGLYRLPDGTEVIVGVGRNSHYFLYHLRLWTIAAWIVSMPVAFESRENGKLVTGSGKPTQWSIEDLMDTGITPEKMQMA